MKFLALLFIGGSAFDLAHGEDCGQSKIDLPSFQMELALTTTSCTEACALAGKTCDTTAQSDLDNDDDVCICINEAYGFDFMVVHHYTDRGSGCYVVGDTEKHFMHGKPLYVDEEGLILDKQYTGCDFHHQVKTEQEGMRLTGVDIPLKKMCLCK